MDPADRVGSAAWVAPAASPESAAQAVWAASVGPAASEVQVGPADLAGLADSVVLRLAAQSGVRSVARSHVRARAARAPMPGRATASVPMREPVAPIRDLPPRLGLKRDPAAARAQRPATSQASDPQPGLAHVRRHSARPTRAALSVVRIWAAARRRSAIVARPAGKSMGGGGNPRPSGGFSPGGRGGGGGFGGGGGRGGGGGGRGGGGVDGAQDPHPHSEKNQHDSDL